MTPEALTDELKAEAARLGFDLAGAAPAITPPETESLRRWLADGLAGPLDYLSGRIEAYQHPRHLLAGVRSVLMLAINYRSAEPNEANAGQGRVSRYAWGTDYHDLARGRLHQLADFHRRLVPGAEVRGVVDTAPILEKQFAQLAGLGHIGKNTLLLNERLGSWIFLGGLLTTEALRYDAPHDRDLCGTCRACLEACPSGALTAPYRLDARKCVSCLTVELAGPIPSQLRGAIDNRLFGCDACQEACPHNRDTPPTDEPDLYPHGGYLPGGMNPVDLADVVALDERAFRERFRRSPIWRAKRCGLLRNALIALGNRPNRAWIPPLQQGLSDPDPIVRGASAWALGQLPCEEGRRVLQDRLTVEQDTHVRGEIRSAVS